MQMMEKFMQNINCWIFRIKLRKTCENILKGCTEYNESDNKNRSTFKSTAITMAIVLIVPSASTTWTAYATWMTHTNPQKMLPIKD
jgi:hypothetical protein